MMDDSMTRRDPSPDGPLPRDPAALAVDAFLQRLPETGQSQWPHRLLMELECINDPVELEAVKILIDERIAWLKG